jgi:Zn-dependent M28 family amino/carboxypeptidase
MNLLTCFAFLLLTSTAALAQTENVIALPSSTPFGVDSARLFDDVRTLASPAFEGRLIGTPGNRQAGLFVQQRFAALGLQPFGTSIAQPFKAPAGKRSPAVDGVNFIGFIKGTAQPERYLLVSAHYDHLGIVKGKLYAGADDNASGVAAMLAVAAYFKAHPPAHTVVFAAFDGEEGGLRGAKAFLAGLPFPKEQLALVLNFDMVSHNDRNEIYTTGTHYTPSLIPLVAAAAARHTVQVKLGHDQGKGEENWTHASDHGPFHDAGLPFLYFGVEDHPDYHQPGDTFEHINQPFFAEVAGLLVDVAAEADRGLR